MALSTIFRWTGALAASNGDTHWQAATGTSTNWLDLDDNSTTLTPGGLNDEARFDSGAAATISGPGRADIIEILNGTPVTISDSNIGAGGGTTSESPFALLVDGGAQLTIAPGAGMSNDGVTDVIGLAGDGSLEVQASGGFDTTGLIIGDSASGNGEVTASGAFLFSVNQSGPGAADGVLVIGQQGTGSLQITSGSQFFTSTVFVGQSPGAVGDLDVEDSTWGGAGVTIGASGIGHATIGDGSTALLTSMLIGANGELDVTGAATVSVDQPTLAFGVLDVTDGGAFVVGDIAGDAGAVTVNGGLPLVGLGSVNGNVVLKNGGQVQATGVIAGALEITGNISGNGTLAPLMTLEVNGGIGAGITIAFSSSVGDATGDLVLDIPGADDGVMQGFGTGNTIDISGSLYPTAIFMPGTASSPGTLTLSGGSDPALSLLVAGTYAANAFLATLGTTDTIVTLACFAGGTRLRGPAGELAVETLRPGDQLCSHFGGTVSVSWIGYRHVDCIRHLRPQSVWPVRVRAGAFAEAVPARDVFLSPDHAVYIGGVLIPIRCLMNGISIVQERVSSISYFHVELPQHDVLLADGLPAESYLDTGNRGAFANGGPAVIMHPDFGQQVWAAQACAEQVTEGPILAAVAARLARRVTDRMAGACPLPGYSIRAA